MTQAQAIELINIAAILAKRRQHTKHSIWWEAAALTIVHVGRWRIFSGRSDESPYLLRCWLTPQEVGDPDSHNVHLASVLHFFARGDADGAMHDHPCDFSSYLLEGSYSEELPSADWPMLGRDYESPKYSVNHHTGEQQIVVPTVVRGPTKTIFKDHCKGERISHKAEDLHAVKDVEPGTVTIVQMGEFRRPWGFHPPGLPWVEAHTYLDSRKST